MSEGSGDNVEFPIEGGTLRAEYERELGTWLRRRLGYLCLAYAAYQILSCAALIFASRESDLPRDDPSLRREAVVEARGARDEHGDRAPTEAQPSTNGEDAATRAELLESARAQRERSAEAVVSTLDAFSAIALDVASELKSGLFRHRPKPSNPRMMPVDRWWLDETDPPPSMADRGGSTADIGGPPAAGSSADAPDSSHSLPTETTAATAAAAVAAVDTTADSLSSRGEPVTAAVDETNAPDRVDASAAAVDGPVQWWMFALFASIMLGVVAWFGLILRPRLFTRAELVAAASRMILILGIFNFAFEAALLLAVPETAATPLRSIFFWHLTASLFLPWSWRESLKPIAPLLGVWLLLSLGLAVPQNDWLALVFKVVAVPFLFAPALILCYTRLQWHRNRFKNGFVGRRFLEMRREFQQARAVHESLFPKPESKDWMRFDFGYRPAADIGGDFIHTWTDDHDRFHLAVIDVTGHGLTSAMSVARIHGEIERLRDEYPSDGPAKLLSRLNRYFHRLLARHRLYATAVVLTVDPRRGEARYASAGHPPILLRSRGKVTELPSTTYLLGAVDDATFGEEEVTVQLEERDTLIIFTDGAYDAKSPRGDRFGLTRLREIVGRPVAPPHWTQFLMRLVETFEAGMAEDDLLIAEFTFLHRRSVSSVTGDAPPTALSAAPSAVHPRAATAASSAHEFVEAAP